MKIDGFHLAREILNGLKPDLKKLKQKGTIPRLAIILIGNDPGSISFIKQKRKAADYLGVKIQLHHFYKTPLYQKIAEFVTKLNQDPLNHGIIIQRPLPSTLSAQILNERISTVKDVDGFLEKSKFLPPVALAVIKIFNEIYFLKLQNTLKPKTDVSVQFCKWLKHQNIVLIGRGETAGRPIADTLSKFRIPLFIINSQTENPKEYLSKADIIISAVGKTNIVKSDQIKKNCIVIGVGLHKTNNHLAGDFDEQQISPFAKLYTPTPGGVGPVNVACLMENLVNAAQMQTK